MCAGRRGLQYTIITNLFSRSIKTSLICAPAQAYVKQEDEARRAAKCRLYKKVIDRSYFKLIFNILSYSLRGHFKRNGASAALVVPVLIVKFVELRLKLNWKWRNLQLVIDKLLTENRTGPTADFKLIKNCLNVTTTSRCGNCRVG